MTPSELERETKTNEICDGCGACCAPGILGQRTYPYLEVTSDDLKNDFKSKNKLVAKNQMYGEGAKLFLPVIRGSNDFTQCEHLKGTVLNGARCGCYDGRPTACRIFEPGGIMCQKLRQAWLVHQDKVRWELILHPEYKNSEAVYAVVCRDNLLDYPTVLGNHVLESLGTGPDYIHLRKLRDVECATLAEDTAAQAARSVQVTRNKRGDCPAMGFRAQKGIAATKKSPQTSKKGVGRAHTKAKSRRAR